MTTIVQRRRFAPLGAAVFLAASAFVAVVVFIIQKPLFVVVPRSLGIIAQAVMIVFSLLLLSALAISVALNALYTRVLRWNGQAIVSDYYAHFLCRAVVMPWWLVVMALLVAQGVHPLPDALVAVLVLLVCRVLDIEARLRQVVYGFSGITGYVIVFVEVLVFGAGIALGTGLRLILSALPT